jgi:Cu(I)/Ag(I) efflux system membrane protein CusA/SilA
MLKRVIDWSIANRFLVGLGTLFLTAAGLYALLNSPLDAIPDLSDTQVIIATDYPGQAPRIVEDQVTYPLTSTMLAVPRAKAVRGISMFGTSLVYILFEDGTDIYWARSRVLEYLNTVRGRLPQGVSPALGPDATGVGWVFEYTVEGEGYDLAQLRSLQDWRIRYRLLSVPGVAEVASVGGFVKEYQVELDPARLRSLGIPSSQVAEAIRQSNMDVGGRVVELAEREYMVRGRGYLRGTEDLKDVALMADSLGTSVTIGDIAGVKLGPAERRGVAEKNGEGEVVGGIVVMRFGENAYDVIQRVKREIEAIERALPPGVEIHTAYDRSELIRRAVDNLKEKLVEESLIVALVCLLFLFHLRSALVAILTLPLGILISFVVMRWIGVTANIMSLGGIAIAIGAMVDAAIVMIENVHKHIEREPEADRWRVVADASKEVGPALFFSLLIITLSFLPVFTLQEEEGRLFRPLAFTKTFAMAGAALLAVTVVPVAMGLFVRGRIRDERANPLNRWARAAYAPVFYWSMRHRGIVLGGALVLVAVSMVPFRRLGTEFMPPLNEGTIMAMPTTLPGISVTTMSRYLQWLDRTLMRFPEVESVFGKIGRAQTATDPAPLNMTETVVNLKPESEWREGLTQEELIEEMDAATRVPGVANLWAQPIRVRLDMLATGIRTPIGIKVLGPDLATVDSLSGRIAALLQQRVEGTASAFAEPLLGGYYLEVDTDREAAARYDLRVEDIQGVVATAAGGETLTETVEGLERYPVTMRYARAFRRDPDAIESFLVSSPAGAQIPLGQVADVRFSGGPSMIRSEDAVPAASVFVDVRGRDLGSYVEEAQRVVASQIELPEGYFVRWSGQYESLARVRERLKVVVPLTLLVVFLLLYFNFRSVPESLIVMLTLPFGLVGGVWFLWILGYNLSVAVWVGMIALAGVAAEIGVVMLVYLDLAYHKHVPAKVKVSRMELVAVLHDGAVNRVRPVLMTVTAIMAGLLPILWGSGTGASVMKRIAAPMVGGMVTATLLTLIVIPVVYLWWRERQLRRQGVLVECRDRLHPEKGERK